MGKRGADNQLTRENYNNSSDDESNVPNNNILASTEVMNKRKIAMPKRKMRFSNKFNTAASKAESSFANTFNSTMATTKITTAIPGNNNNDDKPAKLKALNEQFKSKVLNVLSSDPCSNLSSLFTKYTQYLNDINGKSTVESKEPVTNATPSFVAISQKKSNLINTAEPKVPSSGFTFTLNKPGPQTPPTTTKNDKPLDNKKEPSSSSDNEDEDIKIEGPKFTINTKPITEDSVFSFGHKKAKSKEDSDSEDDIEIKGPQFTFTGTVKSDVFKLKPKETKEETNSSSSDQQTKTTEGKNKPLSFSFGVKKTEGEQKIEDKDKPVFTFGQSMTSTTITTNTNASTNLETFSNDVKKDQDGTEKKTLKPTFSFSIPTESKENDTNAQKSAPAFSFLSTQGQKEENSGATKDEVKKPSFSFNSVNSSSITNPIPTTPISAFGNKPDDTTKNDDKPSVSSISSSQNETKKDDETSTLLNSPNTNEEKPSFTFGQSNSTSKPTFTFGQSNNDKTTKSSKLSFSFGKSSTTPSPDTKKSDPKPSFTFGESSTISSSKNDTTTESKPSFTFGTSENSQKLETKPTFTFGNPASSFNAATTTDQKTENKPMFTFGVNSSSTPAPTFNFGKPSTSLKATTNTPSGGFKFSLPFEQKTTPLTIQQDEKKESNKTESGATEQAVTENEERKNDTTTEQESSTPMELQNGEEDDIKLFSQRAKLMVFNTETKTYDSHGVGEMKVLQNKDDKSKARLLCRSDGMGNILLNTSIVKSFNYSPLTEQNENLVKTPTVGVDGKLTTYIVKFKQKADGRSFIKSIEDAKKDM